MASGRPVVRAANHLGAVGSVVRAALALGGRDPDLYLRRNLSLAQPPSLPLGFMKLWIAQGFGVGRIPFAPGTFGSIVGLGWLALLLCAKTWPVFVAANITAVALSVWLCGAAERS